MTEAGVESTSGAGDQFLPLLDTFIDPAGAARRIDRKAPWIAPLLIYGIGGMVIAYLLMSVTMRVVQMNPPANISREQFQQSLGIMEKFQMVGVFATPILIALKLLVLAGLLKLVSMMGDLQLTFRKVFSLVAHASLIILLEGIATFAVIRAKGDEVQTMEDLMPALGLDLAVRGEIGKALLAALHFFSIFEFWYIIVLAVGFATLARCSKGKAFALTAPLWLLPLVFVVVASFFRQ